MASTATPAMIAATMVPWYWVADGVVMPARLQIAQMVSSGPISRPHLMQWRPAWPVMPPPHRARCHRRDPAARRP